MLENNKFLALAGMMRSAFNGHDWANAVKNADVLFNSAYLVEFAVIRAHAERILMTVPKNCPEYSEAHRLRKFLNYFTPVSDKDVPATSLLRSFIGGSSL